MLAMNDSLIIRIAYESLRTDLITHYTYDAMGNLSSITDPLGYTTYCYYNSMNQLIAV